MRRIHKNKNCLLVLLLFLTLASRAVLSSSTVSADNDSVVDEINITVPIACTLGGTGMNTHNATINNGQYNSVVGETTMKAFCNDNNGFSIYAIGYTDNTDGKNVLTNTTLGNTYDIETGTLTTGADSQWAMKLSTVTDPTPTYPIIIAGSTDDTDKEQGDPDFTTFQEVPDDYIKVAYRKAGTDIGTGAEGSTLKSTYQAYISPTQPAGTYTGQVKYTMVHPYNAEAPFACKPSGTTISTIVCMQDISSANISSILESMTIDQQYTLRDKRDGKTYTVSKLKDGNIWMTQNLDLDLDSTKTYTNEDTDIGWNASTNSYDTASWVPDNATKVTSDTTWSSSNTTPESYDPGDIYWDSDATGWRNTESDCIAAGGTWNGKRCNFISSTGDSHYHLGNYYNWTAAVAMNDSSNYTTQYTDVNQSVCPSGWTLPKSGKNMLKGSFRYLFKKYGWSDSMVEITDPNVWETAIKLPLSGGWTISILLNNVGSNGFFWSSIVYGRYSAYKASSGYSGTITPESNSDRYSGNSVRCLTRQW